MDRGEASKRGEASEGKIEDGMQATLYIKSTGHAKCNYRIIKKSILKKRNTNLSPLPSSCSLCS